MRARDLRDRYLRFFASKDHREFPSGPLVPYDVTGRLDESLLFNGAGMVQFKPFFRGVASPPHPRLVTAQKCVRTGDIDSVGDDSHLTFFEMLGNFSFGDYFKEQAIAYSWEFLTSSEWLNLDPRRLVFTVFREDDEAYAAWAAHLRSVGIDPATRVFRLGEETNYWPAGAYSAGPPGPCGPNTEMFYWTPDDQPAPEGPYDVEDYLRDEAGGRWLEIWNDVFIQYDWQGRLRNPNRPSDGYIKEGMPDLPFRSVDTGMGLERTAVALGDFASIYDIDVFQPILRAIDEATGELPIGPDRIAARRIIADHARTAAFCIGDGVLPSNSGRGYVLRRLIRRAVLRGERTLGIADPFFAHVVEAVVASMKDLYPDLEDREPTILETVDQEEAQFRRTLHRGIQVWMSLREALPAEGVLAGADAFQLYDTYGFPIEVTRELAAEANLAIDEEGFEAAMREAQERSRAGSGVATVYGGVDAARPAFRTEGAVSRFVGYEHLTAHTRIVAVRPVADGRVQVALAETPLYPASGGQESDTGVIEGDGIRIAVEGSVREEGLVWHVGSHDGDVAPSEAWLERSVCVAVDHERRRQILPHHTGTHLLHAALRDVLGRHVTQAGSLVAADHLRFDFTHGQALSPDEVRAVEDWVNERIWAAIPVETLADVPIDEARAMGAMALFGEKYGDRVRVVRIADQSIELCGGTHCRTTAEIGLFKIKSEASAAGGVRRIVALAGEAAYRWACETSDAVAHAAALLKANPAELVPAVERALEHARDLNRRLTKMRSQAASTTSARIESVGACELAVEVLEEGDAKEASLVADRLAENRPNRVSIVALRQDGKLLFVTKVGPEALAAGAHAGNLVREMARIAGGGGGGRPDFATAGGRDPGKLEDALAAGRAALALAVGA